MVSQVDISWFLHREPQATHYVGFTDFTNMADAQYLARQRCDTINLTGQLVVADAAHVAQILAWLEALRPGLQRLDPMGTICTQELSPTATRFGYVELVASLYDYRSLDRLTAGIRAQATSCQAQPVVFTVA